MEYLSTSKLNILMSKYKKTKEEKNNNKKTCLKMYVTIDLRSIGFVQQKN